MKQLHEFLYGENEYSPSDEVSKTSASIVSKVGQKEAVDDATLNSQTYIQTEEDKAQESVGRRPSTGTSTNNENVSGGSSGSGSSGSGTGGSGAGGSGTGGSGTGGSGTGEGGSGSGSGSDETESGGEQAQ